jgi:hypothetical protein
LVMIPTRLSKFVVIWSLPPSLVLLGHVILRFDRRRHRRKRPAFLLLCLADITIVGWKSERRLSPPLSLSFADDFEFCNEGIFTADRRFRIPLEFCWGSSLSAL